MADLETRVDNLDSRVSNLEIQVAQISTKIDMFVTETREQNKMRAEEITALRQDMNAMQARTDAKIDGVKTEIAGMNKEMHNLVLAAMVGIGAIAAAVIGFVIANSPKAVGFAVDVAATIIG